MTIKIGGRLGDIIMYLSMCKYISLKLNTSCDVYLADDDFRTNKLHRTCEQTYKDVYNLIKSQSYVNDFKLYEENQEIDVDLTNFRKFRHIPSMIQQLFTWPEVFIRLYFDQNTNKPIKPCKDKKSEYFFKKLLTGTHNNETITGGWLTPTATYEEYSNSLIISRSNYRPTPDDFIVSQYHKIIEPYKDNVYFACYEKHEFVDFKRQFNAPVEPIFVSNLEQWWNIIGSCELFLCNMTSSACFAYGLNQNRILEPWNDPVALFFAHESIKNPKQRLINSYYNDFPNKIKHWELIKENIVPGRIILS